MGAVRQQSAAVLCHGGKGWGSHNLPKTAFIVPSVVLPTRCQALLGWRQRVPRESAVGRNRVGQGAIQKISDAQRRGPMPEVGAIDSRGDPHHADDVPPLSLGRFSAEAEPFKL